ncbi:MAG: O-antigen ligase family protein [Patescibacteria group bacterium]
MTVFIFISLAVYFLVILRKPHWGIYLILTLLPAYQIRFTVWGVPATFLELLVLILAAVTFLHLAITWVETRTAPISLRLWRQNFEQLFFLLFLFLAAGAVAAAVSPSSLKALGIFKAYFAEGFLFWLLFIILIDSKEKLYGCMKALGVLVCYLAGFGLYQFFTLYRLPPAWWGLGLEPRRVVSLYTYPNAVALLITPILSLFTALLIFYKNIQAQISKKFLIVTLALGLILLVLTFSRGGWIGYAFAVLLLTLFSQYRKYILAALAIGLVVILLIPMSRNRLLPAFSGQDPAGNERIKLWQTTGQIIAAQPVLGAGLMGFREWYGAMRPNNHDEILNYPHNFFLNFWVETGLFGLLSVLGILLWTFWEGWKIYKSRPEYQTLILAGFAALAALLAHGMLDAPFFKNDLSILFWFLLAIVPVLKSLEKNQAI